MEDIRISIRLTEEEHKAFKIVAVSKGKTMQELLRDYVLSMIKKEEDSK